MLSVAQGHLFATVFEAILYGIYFTLFTISLFAFKGRKNIANKIIRYTICLMFCLSTAHIAGTIRSLQEGFFEWPNPESYFNSRALGLNLANKSLYGVNMVVGDSLLIYRLYIIYQGRWIIIALPIVCLIGTAVTMSLLIWEFSRLVPGETAFVSSVNMLAPAVFAVPLATNIIITALIVLRMAQAQWSARKAGSDPATVSFYRRVIANTIESCALYPLILIITLILYCQHNNGQDIVTGSMTQIVSIVPTLMWLQVRFGASLYEAAALVVAEKGKQEEGKGPSGFIGTEIRFARFDQTRTTKPGTNTDMTMSTDMGIKES